MSPSWTFFGYKNTRHSWNACWITVRKHMEIEEFNLQTQCFNLRKAPYGMYTIWCFICVWQAHQLLSCNKKAAVHRWCQSWQWLVKFWRVHIVHVWLWQEGVATQADSHEMMCTALVQRSWPSRFSQEASPSKHITNTVNVSKRRVIALCYTLRFSSSATSRTCASLSRTSRPSVHQ